MILCKETSNKHALFTFTFTFMHLADAFIQSDLHCIQVTVSTFYLAFPGNRTHDHIRIISECDQSKAGSRSVKEIFTSVTQISCTASHSTATLLQTATSILTLHRLFLTARYLSVLSFSGEHER